MSLPGPATVDARPKRILILRFSAAGDILLLAPALEALALAWPHAEIVVATKAQYADLVRSNPYVHTVVPLQAGVTFWQFHQTLQNMAPDIVLDLQRKLRTTLLKYTLSTKHAPITWPARPWRHRWRVLRRKPAPDAPEFFADRYHHAIETLVGRSLPRGRLRYVVRPEHRQEAAQALAGTSFRPAEPFVVISPGAAWATKRWPAGRFGLLAARLIQHGRQVVISGSPAEKSLASAMLQSAPGAVDLCGNLSLTGLGALLDKAAAFVGNDSGPMHMARALGVPTLAIFGPTDPGYFDFSGHQVLRHNPSCAPCSFHGDKTCPRGHFRCMTDMSVEDAWNHLRPLLAGGRRSLVSG